MAASALDKLKKYKSLFSTTLSTGIGTGTSDTITPATVTGLPTDTGITLTIDRVDSSGTATPSKMERISGVISGGNLIDYVRGVDSTTEQAHTAGAVVEMVWNSKDLNDLVDWGLVQHDQLGVHTSALVTSLKTTGAKINAGLVDDEIVTPKAIADSAVSTASKTETFTNKTLTSPKINEDVALTSTSTELNTLDGSGPRKSVFYGSSLETNIAAGETKYIALGLGSSAYSPSIQCPVTGTLKRMYIYLSNSPGVDKTITFTLMISNTAKDLSVAITNTNTGSDTTHSAAISAGQFISIRGVSGAGATTLDVVSWSLEFDAD